MSLASTAFLFLFLPIAIGLYFLLPQKKELLYRNLFLLAISLFFYAWGEPVFVVLLLMVIVMTWAFGKMAQGRGNTAAGNLAVFLTILMNVGVLSFFSAHKQIVDCVKVLTGKDVTYLFSSIPLGLAFFAFHSISYVVDIYRGQCRKSPRLFDAALYLSVFFKVAQGPIIPFHDFAPQISSRTTTWNDACDGIWRFAQGFCKKMLVAAPLTPLVNAIFSSEFSTLPLADAWIGCLGFMIVLYYDFSGYSDMAIGLANIFGFKMPENFNYPYISQSIGEYWRRWHITLCAWFRDYLYYPIVLGPSVKFRKFLLRHHVNDQVAKQLQNIFVPSCIWLVTALWHGRNWNYTLWGVINGAAMIIESRFIQARSGPIVRLLRWFYVIMILLLTVPLIRTDLMSQALCYVKALLGGTGVYSWSGMVQYYLNVYWILLLVSIAGSLRLFAWL